MKDLKNFNSFEIKNVETVEGGWCNCACGNTSTGGFSTGGFSTGSFSTGDYSTGGFDFSSLGSIGSIGSIGSTGFDFSSLGSTSNVSIQTVHPQVVQQPVFTNFWWCD